MHCITQSLNTLKLSHPEYVAKHQAHLILLSYRSHI